tara:strand:+ start:104 stop:1147 length:1044 start_codon:yes stop_codon:yes gene_type:complete
MTVATSNIRTLIPFKDGNWEPVIENEIFSAISKNPPKFWGLNEGEFTIFDMTQVSAEEEDNQARAGGIKLKAKDLDKGWDVTQRPLIVVYYHGNFYLWDGFNRWWKFQELGVTTAPVWLYNLKEGYDFQEVKEHVQLSANNHAKSDEATKRDFINTGVRWAERNNIDSIDEITNWIDRSEHQFKSKEVDKIAATILIESETTNVRHISAGSAARKEAYDFLDLKLEYGNDNITNPIVLCTKEKDYINDAFMIHMKKFVQDENDLETTQLIGYTKGCESEQEVIDQRQYAKNEFDKLDKLICKYAYLKSQLNGKAPYEWEGFLPQLFGKEVGNGIPVPNKQNGIDLPQ